MNQSKRYDALRPAARAVSDEFAATLSVIALTPKEAAIVKPYYLGMLSGHLPLWDRDGFFEGVLGRLQGWLAELGVRRYVDEDGYEYWDAREYLQRTRRPALDTFLAAGLRYFVSHLILTRCSTALNSRSLVRTVPLTRWAVATQNASA